ncbi:hypothetical protein [Synechococcus sp. PCC 7336]|uniref:DUF6887 family protein n=1 Tax=Synechococcus sp. PCC 7336 TaxID=195250 RepID=UPI00034762FA|nr:hypothetical protein [Synechococcus sp. PCC 7336]
MTNLKQLTIKELKQFISENRADDDKCSAALGELLTRDTDGPIYPANMPREEMQRVLQEKLEQVKRAQ